MLRWCLCLLGALCCINNALAQAVLVVSSDRNGAIYAEAAKALVADLQRLGVRDVAQREAQDLETTDFSGNAQPKVVVTLGVGGFKQALARKLPVPIIAALIPRQSFDSTAHKADTKAAVAALYLDQPITRQLDLLRLALPSVKRVGVLWGPESVLQQPAFLAAMRSRGLQEVPAHYAGSTALFDTLQTALDDVQVLLAWPDPVVYNSATIANILMTTYRAGVPVMGFSPAYVKAGALMSVHTTLAQQGQQAALMVLTTLQTGALPPSQYPVDFEVSVNERVARTLGLDLNAADLSARLHKLDRKP